MGLNGGGQARTSSKPSPHGPVQAFRPEQLSDLPDRLIVQRRAAALARRAATGSRPSRFKEGK
jgi:hypothetical protein